jgi:hypothetical protein
MTLKLNGSTNGSVSIDAPADTSPSGTDVTLTLPTSAGSSGQYLQTNGSGTLSWQTVTSGMTADGPAFYASRSANYDISHNTEAVIQFNQEEFDTDNCYNTSTYRFTPTVAGYYFLAAVGTVANTAGDYLETGINIRKNGSTVLANLDGRLGYGGYSGINCSGILYANGSTDYFDATYYYFDSDSETLNFRAGMRSGFWGALIREA